MFRTYFNIIVLATLSIWNINGQESALDITTTSTTSIKPITNYPYQTTGFSSNGVKSGPILLIDKKTVFISNLHYDGSYSGARFWAGTGLPSSSATLVPDENNTNGTLKIYSGQNIYLQLPGSLTVDQIDYLGIWSKEIESEIAYVSLYLNATDETRRRIPEALGFHQKTQDNKTIFRVPKCCAFNNMFFTRVGCQPSKSQLKIDYNVYASNETHLDPDQNMSNVEFIPYQYMVECPANQIKIALDGFGTLGFIYNSSIIYSTPSEHGILGHGKFCVENSNTSDSTKVIVCVNNPTTEAGMPNLYFPILIISTICFLLSALCYLFILKATDVHRKCFIGYSSSMTITFLSLVLLQKLNSACGFTGGLFIFSMLCSHVWLSCLCIDLIFIVKSYKRFSEQTRIYSYTGLSLGFPIIFVIASLSDGVADVPKSFIKMYSQDMCSFEDSNIAIFFTPIGLLILVCAIALGCTSYLINAHNSNDIDWVRNKSHYKFMLIQCIMIFIVTIFSDTVELILNLIDLSEGPGGLLLSFVIIESMQGIFVFLVLSGHNFGTKIIEKRKSKRNNIPPSPNDNHELRPLQREEWL